MWCTLPQKQIRINGSSIKIIHINLRFMAHWTSLCSASKYRNISLMQFSVMFHPLSLNSKKRTMDSGLNVSNITFKLEMLVQSMVFSTHIHMQMWLIHVIMDDEVAEINQNTNTTLPLDLEFSTTLNAQSPIRSLKCCTAHFCRLILIDDVFFFLFPIAVIKRHAQNSDLFLIVYPLSVEPHIWAIEWNDR